MRQFSAAARAQLTEPWEECVLYVYDDKQPKVHGRYPEWDGGPVRGTLTIGFGHTNSAGAPMIVQGMRITREQADQILSKDLAPCVARVNRMLTVEVTQHQFDAMVDTDFNCPTAAVACAKLINGGRSHDVPSKLLQFVYSRGEYMRGLVNRRNAEIAWFNHADGAVLPPAPDPDVVFSPKAERNPKVKTMASSKTGTAAVSTIAGTVAIAAQSANEALEPIKQAKGSLEELGLFEHLDILVHNPTVVICIALVLLAVFVWFDRRRKLEQV